MCGGQDAGGGRHLAEINMRRQCPQELAGEAECAFKRHGGYWREGRRTTDSRCNPPWENVLVGEALRCSSGAGLLRSVSQRRLAASGAETPEGAGIEDAEGAVESAGGTEMALGANVGD